MKKQAGLNYWKIATIVLIIIISLEVTFILQQSGTTTIQGVKFSNSFINFAENKFSNTGFFLCSINDNKCFKFINSNSGK